MKLSTALKLVENEQQKIGEIWHFEDWLSMQIAQALDENEQAEILPVNCEDEEVDADILAKLSMIMNSWKVDTRRI